MEDKSVNVCDGRVNGRLMVLEILRKRDNEKRGNPFIDFEKLALSSQKGMS